eukprot:s332_g15.t1
MKLSGRHLLSPLSLLLVAACVTCDAFKLHGASLDGIFFVSDMEGAANVAQLAYQQKKISKNTWKALSNVSCFMEAARSAGLAWTESDAHHHIVLTANGLKSRLEARRSVSGAVALVRDPDTPLIEGRTDYDGATQMKNLIAENELKNDKWDLAATAFESTASLVITCVKLGKPPSFQDIASAAAGIAIAAIGIYNPLLGAVAGMAFSVISGILWPQDPNQTPEAKLYRKIMEDVGISIEHSQVKEAIGNAKAELEAVMDELQWMPNMLGGV